MTNTRRFLAFFCLIGFVQIALATVSTVSPTSAAVDGNGVKLAWPAVPDAENYGVYRGTSPTFSWNTCVRIGQTTGTNYRDAAVTGGKTYYYWIATGYGGKWYVAAEKWKGATVGALPTVTPSVTLASDGRYAYLHWPSVSGAYNYGIYRSTSSTFSWSTAVRVGSTFNTYYYDYTVTKGKTYYYWIASGSIEKWYIDASKWVKCVLCVNCGIPPVVTASVNAYTGYIRLTWSAISGATGGYVVFRSTSSTWSWNNTRMTTTKNLFFYDHDAEPGVKYYYWVCPRDSTYTYANADKCVAGVRALDAPQPSASTQYSGYVKVTWPSVVGCDNGYVVFRSISDEFAWDSERMTTTFNLFFYDHDAAPGVKYHYWVCPRTALYTYANKNRGAEGKRDL